MYVYAIPCNKNGANVMSLVRDLLLRWEKKLLQHRNSNDYWHL